MCNILTNLIVLSAADKNIVLSDPFTMFKSISAEPFIKQCLQNPFGPGVQVQSLQFMCFRVFYHWKFVESRARNCDHFGRICDRNVICATPKYIWEHLCECK